MRARIIPAAIYVRVCAGLLCRALSCSEASGHGSAVDLSALANKARRGTGAGRKALIAPSKAKSSPDKKKAAPKKKVQPARCGLNPHVAIGTGV